jgi:hypothetical protein
MRKTAATLALLKKSWVFLAAFAVASAMMASETFVPQGHAADIMDEIKSSYHAIIIESPKNGSIYVDKEQIPINLTVDYIYTERLVPWRVLSRLFYSIDDEPAEILTIVGVGYATPIPYRYGTVIDISNLSNGLHKIEVIAEFAVDVGHVYVTSYNHSSSPVSFSVFRDQPPNISILAPENKTYEQQDVPLNFTLNEPASRITYSLDGQNNLTISGNMTLTGLSSGSHNITVYATDKAGNMGASETISFTIANLEPQPDRKPESIPGLPVAGASIAVAVVVGAGLLLYRRKRKHKA